MTQLESTITPSDHRDVPTYEWNEKTTQSGYYMISI